MGVTPLADNSIHDKYYYEIVVFTGMRKNSGTDSKVTIVVVIILVGAFWNLGGRIRSLSKFKKAPL